MRNYQKISKLVEMYSDEKVTHALNGMKNINFLLVFGFFIFLYSFLMNVFLYFGFWIWLISVIIIFAVYFYILFTNRVGIGITNNKFIYMTLSRIKKEVLEVDRIPTEKIKAITVKKQLGSIIVKISFINRTGKLKKIRFSYKKTLIGSANFFESSDAITKRLMEIQKIIDKGDF